MQIIQQIGVALSISPRTADAIQRALVVAGHSDGAGGLRVTARVTRRGIDFGFAIEADARETDLVIRQHGVQVYVDPFSAQHLDGSEIDVADDEDEQGAAAFTLTLPKRRAARPKLVA
jgi:Fe-S cluster assembly iron-binding protein IscA